MLAAYGICRADGHLARSADEAVAAVQRTRRQPVALKVQSPDILHKTEAGAVVLKLDSVDAVRLAYERVLESAKRYAPKRRYPRRAGAADGARWAAR